MTVSETIEKAFRAGWHAGVREGENYQSRFEFGGGSTPDTARKADEDQAWEDYQEEAS